MKKYFSIIIILLLVNCNNPRKSNYYEDNSFYIISKNSRTCLDLTNSSIESGTVVVLNSINGSPTQHWKLDSLEGNIFQIRSKVSGLVLGTNAGLTEDRAIIRQYEECGANNHKWLFEKKGQYYTILNYSANKYVTNPGDSDDNFVCIMIYPKANGDSQLWELVPVK